MISTQTAVLLVLAILTGLSIRPAEERRFLAKEDTLKLRGLLAAFIIIFHVSTQSDPVYPLFEYLSQAAVGTFFFLSGFGCMKGYFRDDDYPRTYLSKRFMNLVLPYGIMTAVYWLYYELTGDHHSFMDVVNSLLAFAPLVTYSWFIVSIIVHYVIFYLAMILGGRNKKILFWVYGLFLIADVVLVIGRIRPAWMVESLFSLGVITAFQEKPIGNTIKKNSWLYLAVSLIVTIALEISGMHGSPVRLAEKMLFIVIVMSFFNMFTIKSRFPELLGRCSLEIYMTQGLAKALVRRFYGGPLFVQDLLIYALCLIMAYAAERLFALLRRKTKRSR